MSRVLLTTSCLALVFGIDLVAQEPKRGESPAKVCERLDPPTSKSLSEDLSGRFAGRSGNSKVELLKEHGGSKESEAAVARGLCWLAKQQRKNGSWVFDGGSTADTIAATGMALLPFLGAGQSHEKGHYTQEVEAGLKYLTSNQRADGSFIGMGLTMYSHGIATIALCEAYGMTQDEKLLLKPAQKAIDFIVKKQADDGSWGYSPGTTGDTSIVGWQIQALYAAKQSKDLVVPAGTIKNAVGFLNKVASGEKRSAYGYTAPNGAPGSSLSAVGLLSRLYIDGWTPKTAGIIDGVAGLEKRPPTAVPSKADMYYFYYSTLVMHRCGGASWKDWNEGRDKAGKRAGGMRDWLVGLQEKKDGLNFGSWSSDGGIIGGSCGRVGTTSLAILTLEVYYRYAPPEK